MRRWSFLVVLALAMVTLSGLFVEAPEASSAASPTAPEPTWTSGPVPTKTPYSSQPAVGGGGTIVLHVAWPPGMEWQGWWTGVQWQDGLGDWHDVKEWQGALDSTADGEGLKEWWFPNTLSGTGPFRWTVYREQEGMPLAVSEPFNLPRSGSRTVEVEVSSEEALLPMAGGVGGLWLLASGGLAVLVGAVLAVVWGKVRA